MKKKNVFVIVGTVSAILITILLYFGMNYLSEYIKEKIVNINSNNIQNSVEIDDEGNYTNEFGSYNVSDGWVKSKKYSTGNKVFYVLEETENQENPDNISVSVGKNNYSESNHVAFRQAILAQLAKQMANTEASVFANGTYTDNGYILYEFKIEEDDVTTIQYYIVGDYKYVLIHETAFNNKEETDRVAKEIVNSFTWKNI